MNKDIYSVLRYFKQFSYPPSEDEIYCFLRKKCLKAEFQRELLRFATTKKLIKAKGTVFFNETTHKYTLEEYGIFLKKNKRFSLYSQSKLKNIQLFILLLKIFPQIKFVGLSGSISMMHADKNHDVDLFVITAKNRLWTVRFIANVTAFILGLKRKRLVVQAKDKICLNLFFEESNLAVPKFKQNEYIGHEILQVKPLINKNQTYERFLLANSWIFKLFPNAKVVFKKYIKLAPKRIKFSGNSLGSLAEKLLKWIQLNRIKKHQTTEIITKSQLWFFPNDFEKKLRPNLD